MNFDLTPDQKELRKSVLDFCKGKLRIEEGTATPRGPHQKTGEEDADPLLFREAWRLCGEQGLLGVTAPTRYGGAGQDAVTGALLMEALGYGSGDMGLVFSVAAHLFACVTPVAKFGDELQKERWLPGMIAGRIIASHSITEPNAGSDVFGMSTQAVRKDDHYVLNGVKCFATNAPAADVFLIHAVTSAKKAYFGLTAFIVEAKSKGLKVGKPYKKMGLRGSPMGDVYLEDCVVPIENRLGGEGAGAPVFMHSMNWERTCLFASYLGAMDRQLESVIAYAKDRKQFGRSIGQFQAVSHKVVEMKLRLQAARLLLYHAAWKLEHEPEDTVAAGLAKIAVSEAAVQSALDAIRIHGGLGVMSGEIERHLRDAVPACIFSGTSEIQRNNVARALGL